MVRNHHTPPSPDPAGPGTESKIARPFSPTPEPWELRTEHGSTYIVGAGEGHACATYVATIEAADAHSRKDFYAPGDEAHSNARLILAAPHMLKLLRRLRDQILAPHSIEFDNREQQAGFDSATRAIGLMRVTEFLAELEGGGQ